MKTAKKVFAILSAIAMVFTLSIAARAATITVNGSKGETYTAYKIFDVTHSTTSGTSINYVEDDNADPAWYKKSDETYTTDLTEDGVDTTIKYRQETVQTEQHKYSYTIASDSLWLTAVKEYSNKPNSDLTLTLSADGTKYVVETEEGFDSAAFAAHLIDHKPNSATGTSKTAGDGGIAEISGLEAGYYLVDSSLGALCILNTAADSVTVNEKNSIPTETKEVYNTSSSTWGTTDDAQVGDKVNFKITVTDGKGTESYITVYDAMSDGLTLDTASIKVYRKVISPIVDDIGSYYELAGDSFAKTQGTSLTVGKTYYTLVDSDASTYTVETESLSPVIISAEESITPDFKLVIKAEFVKALSENDELVIFYSATINSNAEIASTANTNESFLQYEHQTTISQTNQVYVHEFDLVKHEENKLLLAGAEFKLYRADQVTNGALNADPQAIQFSTNENNTVYTALGTSAPEGTTSSTDTITTLVDSVIHIKGLDAGDYYLQETEAPDGYNALSDLVKVTVSRADNNSTNVVINGTGDPVSGKAIMEGTIHQSGGVPILNNYGAELPGTGGIGTTIFYVIGTSLVVGAGVLLITRRRMNQ